MFVVPAGVFAGPAGGVPAGSVSAGGVAGGVPASGGGTCAGSPAASGGCAPFSGAAGDPCIAPATAPIGPAVSAACASVSPSPSVRLRFGSTACASLFLPMSPPPSSTISCTASPAMPSAPRRIMPFVTALPTISLPALPTIAFSMVCAPGRNCDASEIAPASAPVLRASVSENASFASSSVAPRSISSAISGMFAASVAGISARFAIISSYWLAPKSAPCMAAPVPTAAPTPIPTAFFIATFFAASVAAFLSRIFATPCFATRPTPPVPTALTAFSAMRFASRRGLESVCFTNSHALPRLSGAAFTAWARSSSSALCSGVISAWSASAFFFPVRDAQLSMLPVASP